MRSQMKDVATWTLSGLLSLIFTFSGVTKLLGTTMQVQNIESWNYPAWARFPIGIAEILLAVGLLTEKYRVPTIYAVYGWAVVAILTHIRVEQYLMTFAPIMLALLATVLLWVVKRPVVSEATLAGHHHADQYRPSL